MDTQRVLARTLYRKLLRESQRIPKEASLSHMDLSSLSFPKFNDDKKIVVFDDRENLQSVIRDSFRTPLTSHIDDVISSKERIGHALDGLRVMYTLDIDSLPTKGSTTSKRTMNQNDNHLDSTNESTASSDPKLWMEQVEWLEPLTQMTSSSTSNDIGVMNGDSVRELPVFPTSRPLFPSKGQRLPVFSSFSDVPVSGMEIPLKIFEPRYREMYNDLFGSLPAWSTSLHRAPSSSSSSKQLRKSFIVPFSHPYQPDQFAKYGWLYEIVQVQDVADETNGKFQLVCNHLVTKPVQIHSIVNPHDFETKATYLRARATVLDFNDEAMTSSPLNQQQQSLQPLEELLQEAQKRVSSSSCSSSTEIKSLVDRLLMASAEGSIWSVAQIWILNLQMQILDLQVKISHEIQTRALETVKPHTLQLEIPQTRRNVSEDLVRTAQAPHKETLESMLMEVSTLVPLLLQDTSHERQIQRLCERIQERIGLL